MKPSINRREFLKRSTVISAGLATLTSVPSSRAGADANNKIIVAVMGTNGRGMDHIQAYLGQPNVEIAYICDVDSRAVEKGLAAVVKKQEKQPKGIKDFREALEDKSVDVLSIAAPNHWHAPATILACAAGKHVYVEKPCCHNPREGELMVAAARKHKRVVQMGNQRRSWPWVIEAIEKVRGGEIGRVTFARTWYNNARGTIGRGKPAAVPSWLDYSLWQGPATERPYVDNLVHYNWHWRWHWGNGELGNNGIHALDVARWGLGVDYPLRVSCGGGRYQYHDDQETPDAYVTTYDFGDKSATWESHSCHPRGFDGEGFGINFYGDKGYLVIAGNGCKIYDINGKELRSIKGRGDDAAHFANFLDCIRNGGHPNSEIEEGVKSTLWCHLGNIAWQTGQTLDIDPKSGRIRGNQDATRLWGREYRQGWEPKV